MDISTRRLGHVDIIRLRGAFRLGDAVDEFRKQCETLMKDGLVQLVLNLSEVPMMDCSAIGAVVKVMTSVKAQAGSIKLVSPTKLVLQTLKMAGLLNIFETYEDEQKAAASLGES